MKLDFTTGLCRFSEKLLKAEAMAGRKAGDVAHEAVGEWNRISLCVPGENGHSASPAPPTHDDVAVRAYETWHANGRPPGTADEDWQQAE